MGNNACSPSPETIDGIFTAGQAGGIIPDITLDRTLSDFLSLNSSHVLNLHYCGVQDQLSIWQLRTLGHNLTSVLGWNATVPFGGVGVIALALSLFLDTLVTNVSSGTYAKPTQWYQRMFGSDSDSKVSDITREYLRLVPYSVSDGEAMADLTDVYDQKLKLSLIELYERITVEQQINTAAVKQWINGAALHLHMRIHGVRLFSVPRGSVEALRLAYRTGLANLIQLYASYLRNNVKERTMNQNPPISAGFLITEPNRKVRHRVVHSICQSPAIAAAITARILSLQKLQEIEDFFEKPARNLNKLISQREAFKLFSGNVTF